MEGHGKAVRLVTNQLHQVQHRRVPVQHHRLILLPLHIDDLFALGDGRQRLIHDAERLQRLRRRMQLPDAAIDQHQARHLPPYSSCTRL